MLQVCTVSLEVLTKNYLVNCVDKNVELKNLCSQSLQDWQDTFLLNVKGLLSTEESHVISVLRKEFANGEAKNFLNKEDYEQILKMREEGTDYCVRVLNGNETLGLLSKREIK